MKSVIAPVNIFLVGYRCTGKTTIARDIAKRIGWKFIDADQHLMKAACKTVAEIVSSGGWPLFRELEKNTLQSICRHRQQVVATGGGVVSDNQNIDLMKENGVVVWLRATPETIFERMNRDDQTEALRPSLTEQELKVEIEETLKERTPMYKIAMTAAVDTEGKTLKEVSEEVVFLLKKLGIH